MPKHKIFAALPLIGVLTVAGQAQATTQWWLGGDGNVTASGTLTLGPDVYAGPSYGSQPNSSGYGFKGLADPQNALSITGASGKFSDVALGLSNVAISGVYANNYAPSFAPDPGIPYSFSYFQPDPNPGDWVSYDNLFYPGGASPQTCTLPPPGNYGGDFDNYGVMLTLANGDLVDLYSNGWITAPGNDPTVGPGYYGAIVLQPIGSDLYSADYTSAGFGPGTGLTFAAPETSTWAMLLLGFAGLGFAGYRTSSKSVAA